VGAAILSQPARPSRQQRVMATHAALPFQQLIGPRFSAQCAWESFVNQVSNGTLALSAHSTCVQSTRNGLEQRINLRRRHLLPNGGPRRGTVLSMNCGRMHLSGMDAYGSHFPPRYSFWDHVRTFVRAFSSPTTHPAGPKPRVLSLPFLHPANPEQVQIQLERLGIA